MPKKALLTGLCLSLLALAGCTTSMVSGGAAGIKDVMDTPYDGPKARIAVMRFENKVSGDMWMSFQRDMARIMLQAQQAMAEAMRNLNKAQRDQYQSGLEHLKYMSGYQDPISTGVKEMLVSALVACDRFLVYERENIGDILTEQELSASRAAKPQAKIPQGQLEGVELYVYGALTEFEAEKEGGGLTIPIPAFGTTFDADLRYKTAKVGMDIRIVDTRTGRIVAVTTVEGTATNVGFGAREKTSWGTLPKSLEGYNNTPVEAAMRKMLRAAVNYIITKTPQDYYHHEK
jgi:curli biogenesis system outer membrane secretion channel CsgG